MSIVYIHRVFNHIIYMTRKTKRTVSDRQTMEEQKKFYSSVTINALLDLADINNVSKQESRRDVEEIQRRVANEGLSFLTVTLPSLGKALDQALSSDGRVFESAGFELEAGCQFPKFLRCYWSRIFDASGKVLPSAEPLSVKAIRQLVYLLYKLEIPPTRDQIDRVVNEFREVDSMLPRDGSSLDQNAEGILYTASHIVCALFEGFDPHDIVPRHGPGAVATGEKNYEKHCFKRIFLSIEKEYPFMEYFTSGLNHVADQWQVMQKTLTVSEVGTAKVVLVPKDSRGPRLISCEPLEYQWIQQGLGNGMRAFLERRSSLAYRQINFADQSVNRRLALEGSNGAPWVTLDMKEASDRVSLWLVDQLWQHNPQLLACLRAARTQATRLPSGDVMPLNKFAPMGSNLCFPVESVVFWALAVSTIVHKNAPWKRVKPSHGWRSYWSAIKRAAKTVFVYGDDIVCKSQDYQDLLNTLPQFGLLFNVAKCCTSGSFRESCGMDAFKGHPVQPLRLKKLWSVHRKQDALTMASYVAFRNAAYVHGLHRVAEFITPLLVGELGPMPVMAWNCSRPPHEFEPISALALVEHGTREGLKPRQNTVRVRYNKRIHCVEVRCLIPTPVYKTVWSDDWSMILRRLTSPGRKAPGVFPLAHRVTLKWAWIRAGG